MASLVDIPSHLLTFDNKDAFLAWLKALPCETWIRRSLARAWASHVHDQLSDQDYIKAGL